MNTLLINIFLFALLFQGALDARVQQSPNIIQSDVSKEMNGQEEAQKELLQKTSSEKDDPESERDNNEVQESRSFSILSNLSRLFKFVVGKVFKKKNISEDILNEQKIQEIPSAQQVPLPPPLPPRLDSKQKVNKALPEPSLAPPLPPRPDSKKKLQESIKEKLKALKKTRKELQQTKKPTNEVTSLLGNEAMIQRAKRSSNQANDGSCASDWDEEDQNSSRKEGRTRKDTHDLREKIEARRAAVAGSELQESDDSFWD